MNFIKNRIILLLSFTSLFFVPATQSVQAQYSIQGRIFANKAPVDYANIVLYAQKDTIHYLRGTVSRNDGSFELTKLPGGYYRLTIAMIGLKRKNIDLHLTSNLKFDTISLQSAANQIKEVEVTANLIKTFADKDEILVTEADKKKATSGLSLLGAMPQFKIDQITDKLQSIGGGTLKILINGVDATEVDLMSLSPGEIRKVEYYSQLPARYANLGFDGVLNVITVTPKQAGYSVMLNTRNSFTTGYGTDIVSAKFYDPKNEWNIRYFIDCRNLQDNKLNQDYSYNISGTEYEKDHTGLKGSYIGQYHILSAGFHHTVKDNYYLSMLLYYRYNPGSENYPQQVTSSINGVPIPESLISTEYTRSKYDSPVLDTYFSKELPHAQQIIMNAVGTYYLSTSYNSLTEILSGNTTPQYASVSSFLNRSFSIIGEVLYNKKFGANTWTIGSRWFQKILRQNYNGALSSNLSQSRLYSYSSLSGAFSKLSYSVGIGIESTHTIEHESASSSNFTVAKPSLSLGYALSKPSSLRLNSAIASFVPDLSLLALNPVYIDSAFVSTGNPLLKPYYAIINKLQYQYSTKKLFLNGALRYSHAFNPFTTIFLQQNQLLVKTTENQKALDTYGADVNVQWSPFTWLTFNPYYSFSYYISQGTGYRITYPSHSVSFDVNANYKNWSGEVYFSSKSTTLSGELFQTQAPVVYGKIGWSKKNISLSIFYIHHVYEPNIYTANGIPLQYSEKKIWDNFQRLIGMTFIYSFRSGKLQNAGNNRKLNNEDNDSGLTEDTKAK